MKDSPDRLKWLEILCEIGSLVHEAVGSMFGTAEAGESMGIGAGGDTSKRIDIIAENIILKEFEKLQVSMKVMTEEKGVVFVNSTGDGACDYYAIVDPIDGSFNAVRNIPVVSLSIAVAEGPLVKDITDAIVMNLCTGEVFKATRGVGAWLDGRPLQIDGGAESLSDAAIGIDINPKREGESRVDFINEYRYLIELPVKLRVLGSNALGTALVASSGLDGFIDIRGNIRLLDIIGAWLIVKEAGGMVYDWDAGAFNPLEALELGINVRIHLLAVGNSRLKDDIQARATLLR
ncbi:MAG: inositol monophosphatase family protein [Promethearchaeota archaeon]